MFNFRTQQQISDLSFLSVGPLKLEKTISQKSHDDSELPIPDSLRQGPFVSISNTDAASECGRRLRTNSDEFAKSCLSTQRSMNVNGQQKVEDNVDFGELNAEIFSQMNGSEHIMSETEESPEDSITMNANVGEFVPTKAVLAPVTSHRVATTTTFVPTPSVQAPVKPTPFLPAHKQKEKTELCKFWQNTGNCKFGADCSFAHGDDELQKRTHVASKFRMTLCSSFQQAPFVCHYGSRCQFCHVKTDFSNFHQQRTRYQNLLQENARIMDSRISMVKDPDVETFSIAMPNRPRLAVFKKICPSDRLDTKKNQGKNVMQNRMTAPSESKKAAKTATVERSFFNPMSRMSC